MFTKGLSSLSTLAGSAAATAREKAKEAQLDQTAAVRGPANADPCSAHVALRPAPCLCAALHALLPHRPLAPPWLRLAPAQPAAQLLGGPGVCSPCSAG